MGKNAARNKRSRAPKQQPLLALQTPDAAAPHNTPAIATALRKRARQRRSDAPQQQQEHDERLPPEMLQLVGGTLSGSDLAAASMVCRLWSRSLRGGEGAAAAKSSTGGVYLNVPAEMRRAVTRQSSITIDAANCAHAHRN